MFLRSFGREGARRSWPGGGPAVPVRVMERGQGDGAVAGDVAVEGQDDGRDVAGAGEGDLEGVVIVW